MAVIFECDECGNTEIGSYWEWEGWDSYDLTEITVARVESKGVDTYVLCYGHCADKFIKDNNLTLVKHSHGIYERKY